METVQDLPQVEADDVPPMSTDHTSRMMLEIGGHRLAVTHACGDWLILRNPVDLPAGEGTLHLLTGRHYEREIVRLPSGIQAGRRRQPLG